MSRGIMESLRSDFNDRPCRGLTPGEIEFVRRMQDRFFQVLYTRTGKPFAIGARNNRATLDDEVKEHRWPFDKDTSLYYVGRLDE